MLDFVTDLSENPPVLTVRDTIRRRRKALKWTQTDLAGRAGHDKETIVRIEQGKDTKESTLSNVLAALDAGEQSRPGEPAQDLPRHTPALLSRLPSLQEGDPDARSLPVDPTRVLAEQLAALDRRFRVLEKTVHTLELLSLKRAAKSARKTTPARSRRSGGRR